MPDPTVERHAVDGYANGDLTVKEAAQEIIHGVEIPEGVAVPDGTFTVAEASTALVDILERENVVDQLQAIEYDPLTVGLLQLAIAELTDSLAAA